jgi:hypothetical protein
LPYIINWPTKRGVVLAACLGLLVSAAPAAAAPGVGGSGQESGSTAAGRVSGSAARSAVGLVSDGAVV